MNIVQRLLEQQVPATAPPSDQLMGATIGVAPVAAPQISRGQLLNELQLRGVSVADFFANGLGDERQIGKNDIMPVNYLSRGLIAARAVGRVNVGSAGFGTGFLIGDNLLLTNNHVLIDAPEAAGSFVEFEYELDEQDRPRSVVTFSLQPERFFMTDVTLDYTLVFVQNESLAGGRQVSEFGRIPLIEAVGKVNVGHSVSIIQHPGGNRKSVALRDNTVKELLENVIQYEADTQPGSSGAPVFNDRWELVALHHSGVPRTNAAGKILRRDGAIWSESDGEDQIDWILNEGIRVSRIMAHLRANATAGQQVFLRNIIDFTTGVRPNPIRPNPGTVVTTAYYDPAIDNPLRDAYYQGINWTSSSLFADLHTLLDRTHANQLSYQPSKFLYPVMDKHPDGKLQSIYSGQSFTAEELIRLDELADVERSNRIRELASRQDIVAVETFRADLEAIEAQFPYNCEHVVPQSWFNKKSPMRGDLHHLFACEVKCNSFRSNHPYIDFADFTPEELGLAEIVRDACGKGENSRFEPERNKGAVTRATLYYLLRYPRQLSSKYDQNTLKTLLAWHSQFAVTDYERHRNATAAQLQGNRNPLIDFPEQADKIDFRLGL